MRLNALLLPVVFLLNCETPKIPSQMPNIDFPYKAEELSAFANTFGTFVISLKNGQVVKHEPKDEGGFYKWLTKHKVRDISLNKAN